MADVKDLIEQLSSGDRLERWFAAMELGEKGDPSAIPALIATLSDIDDEVQNQASLALGEIGKPSVPALLRALEDFDFDVRTNAAYALGMICDPSTIPYLIKALGDWYSEVGRDASAALANILNNFKSMGEVREFENTLLEHLARLKETSENKHEIKQVEFHVSKLKIKIADKRNKLAGKKDILLSDKPKPPKKRIYSSMRKKTMIYDK